ncbi:MAG: hypothetical protein K0Q97_1966 [Bacillota bacterium]|nr:hypothetical protein [Bacillota bacterium]
MMHSEFVKKYNGVSLEKDELKISENYFEVSLDLKLVYKDYKATKNFKIENYMKSFNKELDKTRFKVDYNKVYPFIRPIGFGKESHTKLLRENLFLNLEVLYAVDSGENFRFIYEADNYNLNVLKESSIKNLNKTFSEISKIDINFEVYTIPVLNVYSASYFLLDNMKKEIENKIGKNYLFAIPSSSTILICKYNPSNIGILKELMKYFNNTDKVSDNIYKYFNGQYDYAEKKEIFKIIK